ncbi:carbohydrate ABC transporter permease [Paenibacillus lignilyticus]|uniref:Carbohydrate ABC transporter permease n=1 Tax=Paenibacillus lignilyticus TaxID=1172615 RepID=A0ABS5C7Z1_9BACL|nr:carbohydrate ABC transporter permease [Paenibacillus lignilyticus]MBP3961782.1 carbohydrate ABC transporter permease [Paenibacillus lignilyticus]MBP3963547.1 carbohydrate ABC transporter permease [Paenibacillus lignilyticus]
MKMGKDVITFNIIAFIVVGFIGIATILPFVMLLVGSFQSESSILQYGYSLLPRTFDLGAYKFIFMEPEKIFHSYLVTIFLTIAGTGISVFFSSMTAYVLARKDVKYRNGMAFYLFFTTLFSGGLVPYYLLMSNYLHLRNTMMILLLNGMFNVIYILILRTYIANSIPDSISESAKIDGANDFSIFIRVVFPLLKPALASIGLFIALGYWNDWYTATLFITKDNLFPLQYTLYRILSSTTFAKQMLQNNGAASAIELPQQTVKLALTVVATGPIVFAYPFVQKYFVAGLTIGSVKG